MQVKSAVTESQIRQDHDFLFLACHPLSKLKLVATVIFNESEGADNIPFETFRDGEVYALGELIDDAAAELEHLVAIARDQFKQIETQIKSLEVNP